MRRPSRLIYDGGNRHEAHITSMEYDDTVVRVRVIGKCGWDAQEVAQRIVALWNAAPKGDDDGNLSSDPA